MFAAFAALTLFELIACIVFGAAILIAVAFDRRGKNEPKWFILFLGLAGLAAFSWSSWTFSSLWSTVTGFEFWKSIGFYLAIGLGYSLLEFGLEVRRSARYFADAWEKFLRDTTGWRGNGESKTLVNGDVLRAAKDAGASAEERESGQKLMENFASRHRDDSAIIRAIYREGAFEIQPHVNRMALSENVGAWSIFWPAYAINLVLGDLLTEIFNTVANIIARLSGRLVKLAFSNVFKF